MKEAPDNFIAKAKKRFGDDYEYLTEYENQYEKLEIRCVKHDHIFQQCAKQHLKAKIPCPICREEKRKEKVKQEFIKELEGKYPKLEVVDYTHGTAETKSAATILFKECGHTECFTSGGDYILNRGDECPTCHPRMEKVHEVRWGNSKDERLEETKARLEKIYDNAFGYDEVKFTGNKRDKVKILCKKHKCYFFQSLSDHENRKEGCPECKKEGIEKRSLERETETFNTRMIELPHLEVLTDFLGWGKYLKVKCKNCDGITEYNKEQEGVDNIYDRFFGNSKYGCPICSERERWLDWEIQRLHELLPNQELHEKYLPHRTVVSIRSKRADLGLRATEITGRHSWLSDEEKDRRAKMSRDIYYKKNKDNPLFKMKELVRNRLAAAFRNKGYEKESHSEELLGCTWEEFKIHIESHEEWNSDFFTWENHGEIWSIDHGTPLDWGETVKEIAALAHHTNCKPMWKTTAIAEEHGVFGKTGNINKRHLYAD